MSGREINRSVVISVWARAEMKLACRKGLLMDGESRKAARATISCMNAIPRSFYPSVQPPPAGSPAPAVGVPDPVPSRS